MIVPVKEYRDGQGYWTHPAYLTQQHQTLLINFYTMIPCQFMRIWIMEKTTTVIGVREWCWTMLLTLIPGVNLIFLAYWAFSSSVNQNKRNYARASWIFLLVVPLAGWMAFVITYMAYNP
ncbi:hypothetical protein [Klebsiella sp. PL-2018]|uniref:hypothetical protein n=1 Tax=Klebsiella sp. PL-2018 TaxID=2851540 RepID=UPI001C24A1A2|nr:hypothetical protein [Klebsiella sp. PL-2018]QXD01169.1 hypothetical protein MKleb_5668 [Klebsiella sp. PL-2018]